MKSEVIIVGAGPVGMVCAASLVKQGIPVTVLEGGGRLATESRASTFHPPTLDMLARLGLADDLMTQGLIAPLVQYRSTQDGILGTFDFGDIADLTGYPHRLQCEQYKLTDLIWRRLRDNPLFDLQFNTKVIHVEQSDSGVHVRTGGETAVRDLDARWVIGADGARSAVRKSLALEFEGFTWPERFLVLTVEADLNAYIPHLSAVTYIADPVQWRFFLRIPGAWRIMVPVPSFVDDAEATTASYAESVLVSVLPAKISAPCNHKTLYRVHQRVATRFRKGRIFLVGDAAHVNNPLGGMGMNGGIHDAINLSEKLIKVLEGKAFEDALDRYDRQRRTITMESVQTTTIQNKKDLEAATPEARQQFRDRMAKAGSTLQSSREMLRRISMIASLERAKEIS